MSVLQRLVPTDERKLDRMIRVVIAAVVLGIAVFGVLYYLERYETGPSLVDRRIETTEEAISKQPNNVELRLQLAEMHRVAGHREDALEQYENVLKINPRHRVALLGRAELLEQEGNLAEADSAYNKVIRNSGGEEFSSIDPQLASAYYGVSSVALKRNRVADAMAAAEKAVTIEPSNSDSLYLYGVVALKSGAPSKAVTAFRRAVLFVPTGWCEPYQKLSEAYGVLKRRANAEYARAMVDFCQKRAEEAASRLKTLTTGPAGVDAMLGLGMIAEQQKDRASAIRWYRKVLRKDRANFGARSGLSRLKEPGKPPAAHGDGTGSG